MNYRIATYVVMSINFCMVAYLWVETCMAKADVRPTFILVSVVATGLWVLSVKTMPKENGEE